MSDMYSVMTMRPPPEQEKEANGRKLLSVLNCDMKKNKIVDHHSKFLIEIKIDSIFIRP